MSAGSLVAWKSSRSVRSVADSLMERADYPMVGWPAKCVTGGRGGPLRPGLGCRLDRGLGCPGPPAFPTIALPGRRPSMVVDTEPRAPPAVTVTSPKRSAVLPAVGRAQLHLDGDEGGHAHHARGDAPVPGREQGQGAGRLLVAGAARLVLGRALGPGAVVGARGLLLGLGRRGRRVSVVAVSAGAVWRRGRGLLVVAAAAETPAGQLPAIRTKFRLDLCADLPIMVRAESHNADAMDTR